MSILAAERSVKEESGLLYVPATVVDQNTVKVPSSLSTTSSTVTLPGPRKRKSNCFVVATSVLAYPELLITVSAQATYLKRGCPRLGNILVGEAVVVLQSEVSGLAGCGKEEATTKGPPRVDCD